MNALPFRLLAGVIWLAAICDVPPAPGAEAPSAAILFDMDQARHRPTTAGPEKRPIGTVEVVPGKFGGACRFRFNEGARSGFFTAGVRADAAWDEALRPHHPVPREHPRLLGPRDRLQRLARERAEAYERVVRVARGNEGDAQVHVSVGETTVSFEKTGVGGYVETAGLRTPLAEKVIQP